MSTLSHFLLIGNRGLLCLAVDLVYRNHSPWVCCSPGHLHHSHLPVQNSESQNDPLKLQLDSFPFLYPFLFTSIQLCKFNKMNLLLCNSGLIKRNMVGIGGQIILCKSRTYVSASLKYTHLDTAFRNILRSPKSIKRKKEKVTYLLLEMGCCCLVSALQCILVVQQSEQLLPTVK